MMSRLSVSLVPLLLVAHAGFAQSGQVPAETLTGMLRRVSPAELVIEANEKGIITISLAPSTKYYRPAPGAGNGNAASAGKSSDFQPGDRVSVEYTQDDKSYYHASKVAMIKAGTPSDRTRALQGLNVSVLAGTAPPPVAKADSAGASRPAAPKPPAPKPPNDVAPQAVSRTVPADSDDPRPSLQRHPGQTNPSTDSPSTQTASARPALRAEEVNGVTRVPEGPRVDPRIDADVPNRRVARSDGDPIIESARMAAFSFLQVLPNYIVKQYTTRYATNAAHGNRTSWQALDTVTTDVIWEDGKESYKNIMVDGKPPKEDVEKNGTWSKGEFGSLQLDVLADDTNADFHNRRSATIANRAAYQYDFTVEQRNSHWHLEALGESYIPAYSGTIWIDKENSRVLRLELSAERIASTFPLDTVETALDYDYVLIGDEKYLLPAHSESISCRRGSGECSRNVIEFRNYRKFTADTSISFGPDQ